MTAIDLNKVIQSQVESIVPGPHMIDGRTEADRLTFLANFASLINFYDRNNIIYDNWKPLLLKDPAFLTAYISKSALPNGFKHYERAMKLLYNGIVNHKTSEDIEKRLNYVLDHFTDLFMTLEEWSYYMYIYNKEYTLKKYTLHSIKHGISQYLWAFFELRNHISQSKPWKNINGVSTYELETFSNELWSKHKAKEPFWVVFGMHISKDETPLMRQWKALSIVGNTLYKFIDQITEYAEGEFEDLQKKKDGFPDTVLLRTFVRLLEHPQKKLNEFGKKHLDFYYDDILKQSLKEATPDSVFVTIGVNAKSGAFQLPSGTLFNAGINVNKEPVYFQNTKSEPLNPAVITNAYTLFAGTGNTLSTSNSTLQTLLLKENKAPSQLKKDVKGKISAWNTFGNSNDITATTVNLGMAFASPSLLLKEGQRNLGIQLKFIKRYDLRAFNNAKIYLSTAKKWLDVTANLKSPFKFDTTTHGFLNFTLELGPEVLPIEPISKNPDGFNSNWPMFKVVFSEYAKLSEPPVLSSLKIITNVSNLKNLTLYNDFGKLSTKAPFELFGPMPAVNRSFIIGSEEIFSKNISKLKIEFNWDQLPGDFQEYYQAYNNYLENPDDHITSRNFKRKKLSVTAALSKIPLLKSIPFISTPVAAVGHLISFLRSKKHEDAVEPYNNVCFKVNFDRLVNGSWEPFQNMYKSNGKLSSDQSEYEGYATDMGCVPGDTSGSNLLFSTHEVKAKKTKKPKKNFKDPDVLKCQNAPTSIFAYPTLNTGAAITGTPELQTKELKYTDLSETGFIRMQLSHPEYGFGADIYGNVISSIAMDNAKVLSARHDQDVTILGPANKPFTPKVTSFIASYSAEEEIKFITKTTGNNAVVTPTPSSFKIKPLPQNFDCFYLSPFGNFEVPKESYQGVNLLCRPSEDTQKKLIKTAGLPLHMALPAEAALYIQVEGVQANNQLNLFFEMARKKAPLSSDSVDSSPVTYSYANQNQWNKLPVLWDGTENLNCSGILQVDIPQDISEKNTIMPSKSSWLCLSVDSLASLYPGTTLLSTNGIELIRTGVDYLDSTTAPWTAPGTITKLKITNRDITSVSQPFQSFGGKAEENTTQMYNRVSNRILTKDRAVSREDYFRLLRENFDHVFYTKAVLNKLKGCIDIYIVPEFENALDPSAFRPAITRCEELSMNAFLSDRIMMDQRAEVQNFKLIPLTVDTEITVSPQMEEDKVLQNVNDTLKIFLSPWIQSNESQIEIDQGVTLTQIMNCILSVKGVESVDKLTLKTDDQTITAGSKVANGENRNGIYLTPENELIVTSFNHTVVASKSI